MDVKNLLEQQSEAIRKKSLALLQANNQVTTLEVKNELRSEFPSLLWKQELVSDVMKEMEDNGTIAIKNDNGVFRVYGLPEPVKKADYTKKEKKRKIKKLIDKILTLSSDGNQVAYIYELGELLKIKL